MKKYRIIVAVTLLLVLASTGNLLAATIKDNLDPTIVIGTDTEPSNKKSIWISLKEALKQAPANSNRPATLLYPDKSGNTVTWKGINAWTLGGYFPEYFAPKTDLTALQTALQSEITRAKAAESTIDGKITTEATTRATADSNLQSQITSNYNELLGKYEEVFQSASNGKKLLATTITGLTVKNRLNEDVSVGVNTAEDATFAQIAENIKTATSGAYSIGDEDGSYIAYQRLVEKVPYTGIYDGMAHTIQANAGEYEIKFGTNKNDCTLDAPPTFTDVGNYVVYMDINFKGEIHKETSTVTITKAQPAYTAPTAKSLVYTGEALTLVNQGSTSDGKIYYRLGTSGEWSESLPKSTNAGTYTVQWYLDGDKNHFGTNVNSIDIVIDKAAGTIIAPTVVTGLVYNGSSQVLVNAGSSDTGTVQYSLNGSTYYTSVTNSSMKGTAAGDYTIYYYSKGDSNHYDTTVATIATSIAKVTPTATAPIAKTLTYNGGSQKLVNAGSTNWGTLVYSTDNSNWGTSIPTGINAGSYTVYWKVQGTSNINDLAGSSFSVSIAKVTPSLTKAPTAKTLVYNGSAQELITAGTVNFGTLKYSVNSTTSSNFTVDLPTGTNAGSYTVRYRIDGDSNVNSVAYTEFSAITMSIAKKDLVYTAPTAITGLKYTGSAQVLINAGSVQEGSCTFYYKLGSGSYYTSVTSSYLKATTVGDYTITWYATSSNSNYNSIAEHSFTVSIAKQAATVTAPTPKTGLVYTGSALQLVTAGSSGTGNTVYYRLGEEGTWVTSVTNASLKATDAGTYKVYYYAAESTNYSATAISFVEVVVTRKSVTIPSMSTTSYSYTGSSITPTISNWSSTYSNKTGDTSATTVGSYTVYFDLVSDNYVWSDGTTAQKSIAWVINKATVTIPSMSTTSYSYTGAAITPTISNWNSSTSTKSGKYSATNAGSYTVYFDLANNNYIWSDNTTGQKSIAWTINKAKLTVPSQSGSVYWATSSVTPSWNNYDSNKLTQTGETSSSSIGEHTVTFAIKDTSNYEWNDGTVLSKQVTWTLSKRSLTIPTINSVTWSGAIKTPTWNNFDSTYETKGGTCSATEVGSYTATVSLKYPTTTTWSDGTTAAKNISWNINKISLVYPAQSGSLYYDGSQQSPSWDSDYKSDLMTLGGTTTGTNPGSYTATFIIKDTTHYKWSSTSSASLNSTWRILKGTPTLSFSSTGFTVAKGSTKTVTVTTSSTGTISTNTSSYYSTSVSGKTITIIGTSGYAYALSMTVTVAATDYYNSTSATLTLYVKEEREITFTYYDGSDLDTYSSYSKAILGVGDSIKVKVVGDSLGTIALSGITTSNMEASVSGSTINMKGLAVTSRDYFFVTVGASGKYLETQTRLYYTIEKKSPGLTLNKDSVDVKINNTATVTATRSGSGAITATSSSTTKATVSVNGTTITVTGKATGTATITVKVAANGDYAEETKKFTVTVSSLDSPVLTLSDSSIVLITNGTKSKSVTATRFGSGAISATSSATTKATVSVNGTTITVTGKAIGKATITVTVAANGTYDAQSKTFEVLILTTDKVFASATVGNAVEGESYAISTYGSSHVINVNNDYHNILSSRYDSSYAYTITGIDSDEDYYGTVYDNTGAVVKSRLYYLKYTPSSGMSLSKSSLSVGVGATDTVTVTRSGTGAITASSSNTSVATVSVSRSGTTITVTGKSVGTATITVNLAEASPYPSDSKTISVTVTKGDPNFTYTLNEGFRAFSNTITVSERCTNIQVSCNRSGNGTISISSSNTNIATVTASGDRSTLFYIYPESIGTATIYLTLDETDSYKAASYSITVSVAYDAEIVASDSNDNNGSSSSPFIVAVGATIEVDLASKSNGTYFIDKYSSSSPTTVLEDSCARYEIIGSKLYITGKDNLTQISWSGGTYSDMIKIYQLESGNYGRSYAIFYVRVI